ncbi:MAG: cupin domain-containing protein [Armatimonadetes bacterium]|nr:cupin domain-containing protein [Armatimonadota bacterium]
MKIVDRDTVAMVVVEAEGAVGCQMGELITARDGAPTFAMRRFTVEPGGNTPYHSHPWEHEVYVLSGCGAVRTEAGLEPIASGRAVLILPRETHSFVNNGDAPMEFLCMIPVAERCCR